MSNRAIVILKFVVFPACLIPLGVLVYQGFTNTLGPDPVATITHTTGFWTLYFLLISLAVTPVRRLSGQPGMADSLSSHAGAVCVFLRDASPDDVGVALLQL